MLIATPYRSFEVRDKSPPRVISEIKKNYCNQKRASNSYRPKLTGDLLVKCGNEKNWRPRRVSIRLGQLLVSSAHGEDGSLPMKIPLRHLSIQAGPLTNSFSLCRGQNIFLTLQTSSSRTFDEWVKIIAIELIRQTPLDAIKYLDILTFQECWKRTTEDACDQDWNFNNNPQPGHLADQCDTCHNHQRTNTQPEIPETQPIESFPKPLPEIAEEQHIEDLLKKCQNVETYVSVKDKLHLFESLCKMGRKVRSTENIPVKVQTDSKRARSLHDLSNIGSQVAVREICKLFENKSESTDCVNISFKSRLLDCQLNSVNKRVRVCKT